MIRITIIISQKETEMVFQLVFRGDIIIRGQAKQRGLISKHLFGNVSFGNVFLFITYRLLSLNPIMLCAQVAW